MEAELGKLSDTASPEQIEHWNALAEEAQKNRVTDPAAMDIYEAEAPKSVYMYDTKKYLSY